MKKPLLGIKTPLLYLTDPCTNYNIKETIMKCKIIYIMRPSLYLLFDEIVKYPIFR